MKILCFHQPKSSIKNYGYFIYSFFEATKEQKIY